MEGVKMKNSGVDNPTFVPDNGQSLQDLNKSRFSQLNGNNKSQTPGQPSDQSPANLESGDGENRAQWGNGIEFLMSCIAMSVGLGNIWRFPFTAYENGGGAFLIPYIIILAIIGRPLYYMEMALGQFASRGNVKMFEALCPALKGIGYGQLLGTICVCTYYCSLMAITTFYLINSFTSDLPWATCKEEWKEITDLICVSSVEKRDPSINSSLTVSSSELWFTKEVLKEKSQIYDGVGYPDWRLTLTLLASWILTFIVSRQGVKSSGKAAYFLAIFPYIVLITLLVRAATLEGSANGMLYFITPDWEKLLTADVWYAAVSQCFFSLSVGFGSIIMYSSYNDFEHNINRDAFIVSIMDTFTSLLAGTTIFGILGNLAYELDVEVEEVVKNSGDTGLAFISYPEAIAKFEAVPWLFALLFFTMLLTLGIGSLVALQGCANTVILDNFPRLKPWQVSAGTAFIGFVVGLVYVTPGGQFILNMVDHFGGTVLISILAIVEVFTVMWWYGLNNFCDDLQFMLNMKVNAYWRITWGFITPVLLLVIFIYRIATYARLTYGSSGYPDSALACGWMIFGVGVAQVFMWIAYYLYNNREYGYPEMMKKSFGHEEWGPKNPTKYEEWKKFKEQKALERKLRNENFAQRIVSTLIGR